MAAVYEYGDLVLLNGRQTSTVTVVAGPGGSPGTYTVTLPINGQARPFVYEAAALEAIDAIAAGLEAVLLDQQTHFSVARPASPAWMLVIVGPPGEDFEVAVSSSPPDGLSAALVEAAYQSPRGIERPVRVLEVRERWTRDASRETVRVEQITGRELETAVPITFDASEVRESLGKEPYSG